MPTPSGKPRKDERVTLNGLSGTVLDRTDGAYWSLRVRWDDGRVTNLVDAPWLMQHGHLYIAKGTP